MSQLLDEARKINFSTSSTEVNYPKKIFVAV
jgi:hypothetical protein